MSEQNNLGKDILTQQQRFSLTQEIIQSSNHIPNSILSSRIPTIMQVRLQQSIEERMNSYMLSVNDWSLMLTNNQFSQLKYSVGELKLSLLKRMNRLSHFLRYKGNPKALEENAVNERILFTYIDGSATQKYPKDEENVYRARSSWVNAMELENTCILCLRAYNDFLEVIEMFENLLDNYLLTVDHFVKSYRPKLIEAMKKAAKDSNPGEFQYATFGHVMNDVFLPASVDMRFTNLGLPQDNEFDWRKHQLLRTVIQDSVALASLKLWREVNKSDRLVSILEVPVGAGLAGLIAYAGWNWVEFRALTTFIMGSCVSAYIMVKLEEYLRPDINLAELKSVLTEIFLLLEPAYVEQLQLSLNQTKTDLNQLLEQFWDEEGSEF
jgi:hypothetical protein